MKKLILTSALALGLTVSAAPLTMSADAYVSNEIESIYTTEVSTFCKLVAKGDFDAVKSMITAGTDVNRKSKGMTPLMYAARHNKTAIALLLIENGADVKARSDKGYTALQYAKMHKAHDAHALISKKIDEKKKERKERRKSRKA